jgi:hypothetical protein
MRKQFLGFAAAVALCTATMPTTSAKAADGHSSRWVGGHSRTVRHNFFTHGSQRRRFAPNLDLWDLGGGWWAGYHYCGGWAYRYGYAPHSCYIFGGG